MLKSLRIKPTLTVCGALLAGALVQTQDRPQQELACGFSNSAPSRVPTIAGPDAVLSRLHVVRQPESPVEITSLDFSGAQLVIEEGSLASNYTFRQSSGVEVRNRSDQIIERIDVRVTVGACQSPGPPRIGPSWSGRLAPGETTLVRMNNGSASGSTSGSSGAGSVLVWVWVDRVDFRACAYKPAQVIPASLCEDRRPVPPTRVR